MTAYFFAPPRFINLQKHSMHAGRDQCKQSACPSTETVRKLFDIAEKFVRQAEILVTNVVEIDGKLADALEAEVLLITGNKATIQPKILTPSQMFRDPETNSEAISVTTNSASNHFFEKDKLFPQIPFSRLSLDFCGVIYNSLLVLKRAHTLRTETAKNKSNALYLANLRGVLKDLSKLQIQRDALDHLIFQSQDQLEILSIQPAVLAEQLSLIDSSLFTHMRVVEELQFASWISRERRQRSPHLTAMREFGGYISHWITAEILKPGLSMQQRAAVLIHFVGVGECLSELASYDMLAAVVRGLSTPAILRLGPLFDILPKRTLMSWDTLQGMVQEPIKQRALLSKAPATCIPAIDTAYLLDLLAIEPEQLCLKSKGSDDVKHKFSKYCEAIEKFRLQSSRVYILKHTLHPAVQHFLLSRQFLSSLELQAASDLILPPSETAHILTPETCLIKHFHRRYLDDDERLFLPLKPVEKVEVVKVEIEETFSLGEQPETKIDSFYPMNDAVERAARNNTFKLK